MFIIDNKENLVNFATKKFINAIKENEHPKFILPTGNAPIEMYENVCLAHENEKLSLLNVTTFNLDEYINNPNLNPKNIFLREYMEQKLFDRTDIKKENTHFPIDVDVFNQKLDIAEKIDIAFVGLGENGHIGFNEPGCDITRTNVSELTPITRKAISTKKEIEIDDAPTLALTMGLKDIIEKADKVIILAWGPAKAAPLKALKKALINNEVDKNWPVTNLIKAKELIVLTDQWLD